MSAVGDARKRHAEQHHTHPDPAVRELIAAAEARGAERERARITDALEALPRAQDEVDDGWVRWGAICALLAGHRSDERPAPEALSDVTAEQAWDAAVQAVAWCLDNGEPSAAAALAYVAGNNPYRTEATP